MNRIFLTVLLAAILFSAVVIAYPQGNNKPLKIGVVNIASVFDKFNERQKRADELKAIGDRLNFEIESLGQQAQKLKSELEGMEEGTEEYLKKLAQYIKVNTDAQVAAEKGKQDLLKRELSDMQELYTIIREAISKYAEQNGYDLILKTDDLRVTGQDVVSQDIEMRMRTVLYNGKAMDLTATITEIVNKK